MKVAYLMNGVIGGLSGKNYEGYDDISIQKQIIQYTSRTHHMLIQDNVEIDYFIFSWEPDLHDTYINVYQPKKIKSQSQIKFDMPDHYKDVADNPRVQAHYSRWYGAKEVLNLLLEYIRETNTTYDLVINTRLDLCYQQSINLKTYDNAKFHIARPVNNKKYNWPDNIEVVDRFFASSLENMTNFLQLFNFLNEYTLPGQCQQWKLISSHFLAVWHLQKIGLLNESIITESITEYDGGYNDSVDYYIFRYKNLTVQQLKDKV